MCVVLVAPRRPCPFCVTLCCKSRPKTAATCVCELNRRWDSRVSNACYYRVRCLLFGWRVFVYVCWLRVCDEPHGVVKVVFTVYLSPNFGVGFWLPRMEHVWRQTNRKRGREREWERVNLGCVEGRFCRHVKRLSFAAKSTVLTSRLTLLHMCPQIRPTQTRRQLHNHPMCPLYKYICTFIKCVPFRVYDKYIIYVFIDMYVVLMRIIMSLIRIYAAPSLVYDALWSTYRHWTTNVCCDLLLQIRCFFLLIDVVVHMLCDFNDISRVETVTNSLGHH